MKLFKTYFIFVVTLILINDLYSQSCVGKDFNRAEWFANDSLVSNVSSDIRQTNDNITLYDDELRIVDNFNHNVEKVELYTLEGKMIDFKYKVIKDNSKSLIIKSDDLKVLKSNIYILSVISTNHKKFYKFLIAK